MLGVSLGGSTVRRGLEIRAVGEVVEMKAWG